MSKQSAQFFDQPRFKPDNAELAGMRLDLSQVLIYLRHQQKDNQHMKQVLQDLSDTADKLLGALGTLQKEVADSNNKLAAAIAASGADDTTDIQAINAKLSTALAASQAAAPAAPAQAAVEAAAPVIAAAPDGATAAAASATASTDATTQSGTGA